MSAPTANPHFCSATRARFASLFASLYKIGKVNQRPDHQRQIQRLRHRRGLHIDKVGIEGKISAAAHAVVRVATLRTSRKIPSVPAM